MMFHFWLLVGFQGHGPVRRSGGALFVLANNPASTPLNRDGLRVRALENRPDVAIGEIVSSCEDIDGFLCARACPKCLLILKTNRNIAVQQDFFVATRNIQLATAEDREKFLRTLSSENSFNVPRPCTLPQGDANCRTAKMLYELCGRVISDVVHQFGQNIAELAGRMVKSFALTHAKQIHSSLASRAVKLFT
ncbi:hypothetical protein DVDV_0962 [Desulfovibrio sp. DV]|nr:hypothetical protein DVDV_0962 [Desulfovibrio sp. DV]